MSHPIPSDASFVEQAEAHRDAIIELLQELVRTPSVTGLEASLRPSLTAFFDERGWPVEWTPLAGSAAAARETTGREQDLDIRGNTVGWYRSTTGRAIVTINAHIDTVPVVDQDDWTVDPFGGTRTDGRVYGRGSVDTKGGAAAALFALQILDDLDVRLPFDLAVELVVAEESTGLGTEHTLEQRPSRLATIVVEPTGNEVVVANSGVLFFTVEIDGHAAHTSQPWRGANAIEKAVRVWTELEALGARRESTRRHPLIDPDHSAVPLVIGTLQGGGFRAAVPSHATMSGRVGVLPGESLEDVRGQMRDAIERASEGDDWLAAHPIRLIWDHEGAPGWEVPTDLALVSAMLDGQAIRSRPGRPRGLTSGCDAGIVHAHDIPVVVFGPGDMALAHSVDEHVEEDEVVEAAAILASSLASLGALLAATTTTAVAGASVS